MYEDKHAERAGRTGAHEMGHSITSFHHNDCIMVANPSDLPNYKEPFIYQHFCEECQKKWWNKNLGGE